MISAVNLRQRLSGNKLLASILALLILLSSCATRKATVYTPHPQPKKENRTIPTKVDTFVWKKETQKNKIDPKKQDADKVLIKNEPSTKAKSKYSKEESIYRALCLFPFKSSMNDTSSTKLNTSSIRYIQYLAGMNLAIEELEKEAGRKIVFDVLDCESISDATDILKKYESTPPHLIIGPQKIETVKYVADWAKSHETSLISPWISSSSIASNNPYYIQLKAGLSYHYSKINEHARSHYPSENIILISKSKEESKIKYFNDSLKIKDSISEKFFTETDLSTGVDPIITPLFKTNGPTVFILPYFSSKDENYIYHFLRRVVSEKANKEVIIYGTYKWLEMKNEIVEYMNVNNIRISMSNFYDPDNSSIKSFKKRYFDKYREFPSQDAFEGYDLAKYSIKSLRSYGPDFQWKSNNKFSGLLQTNIDLQAIQKSKLNDRSEVDYYENSFLEIVELKNNKFKVIN